MVEKWLPKTPDLEEVIRCRDCKFSANDGWRCRYWADEWEKAEVHPDGFCVWAERREP
jgi:MoaA/NifB/PqqE/SkfB family radical SAM enzyme